VIPAGRLALAVALLLPATTAAQDRDQREAIWRWHDSLQQITDTTHLRSLHRMHLALADSAEGEPMAELRLGAVTLRLAEVSGDARLVDQAARGFTGVTEDHPDWPLGWTGLAQAELAEARSGSSVTFGLAQMFGLDPEAKIVAMYLRGAGADSSLFEGIADLSRRALRGRVEVEEQVALRVLRGIPARAMARSPEIALLRSRLEREIGEKDSAIAVIERAARLHDDDPLILRAQAQMRFVVGRPDGAGPWYRGLERARDEALARFERDLQMVVPDSIMARLRGSRPGLRAELIREFWRSQDPDGLPTHDDRLAEHYRRLEFARHNYVRPSVERAVAEFELDTLGIAVFDPRGEMILRHGTPRVRTSIGDHGGPDVEVTLRIIGMPANESWAYTGPDGVDRFYHFVKPARSDDFRSVESILDILAYSEQFKRFRPDVSPLVAGDTTHRTILVHGAELVSIVAQELLVSRHQLSPLYAAMIDEGMDSADSTQALERVIGREALTVEYTYELGFEMPLDAAVDILAVGSDQHGPIMQVAFAISGADLTPQSMPRGVVYPIRMRIAVVDGAGRIVSQVDTTRGFLSPARLRPSQQLVGQLPVRVPPGQYRVRVALEAERRGYLSRPTMVELTAGRETLTLSDVSIGVRSVPIQWRSPTADTAWANPRGRYRADEELQLYFEIGGLADGTRYRTQIAIDRVEAGTGTGCEAAGTALTLSFDGEHPGRVAREQRAVSLDRLRPGNYLMAVTISTESGARATRCRRFTVVRE
jgi:hypothetical protein